MSKTPPMRVKPSSRPPQPKSKPEATLAREVEEVSDPTALKFKTLLGDERVARPQQQAIVQNIARAYGNQQVQRVLAQTRSNVARPAPSLSSRPLISLVQRFDSFEHQSLGNNATGNAKINLGGTAPGQQFELLHGDIIALSGDYFLTGDKIKPTDDLMQIAATPSKNGKGVNTQDEIIYALQDMDSNRHKDARFQPGGIWNKLVFSDEVKNAVTERFNRLAAANNTHFAAPHGRYTTGKNKGQAVQTFGGGGTAGASYRSNHELALREAYKAGQSGGPLDKAMIFEAAGQHFLTDSFSAGHARTPIGSIREYWKSKYPLFWYNFLHKLALDTATEMNNQPATITYVISVQRIYEGIMEQVNQIAATLPEINLGDLVAKVFHDYDNENGVALEGGGKLFGDDHLDDPDPKTGPKNVTRQRAEAAIQAGNKDVNEAFTLGQNMLVQLDEPGIQSTVRQNSGQMGDSYAAETMLPKLATTNPAQNWQAASIEDLWNKPIVAGAKQTVGSQIIATFQPGQDLRKNLETLAGRFPPETHGMHPQDAYRKGFLNPLVADLYKGLLGTINWSPNYGLSYTDKDDVSLETGQELDNRKQLGGMTTPARINYVKELVDGSVAPDEEDMIIRIFETAPVTQRQRIYKGVESRDWSGNFHHGRDIPILDPDDDLWKNLDAAHRTRLRKIINGQAAGKP